MATNNFFFTENEKRTPLKTIFSTMKMERTPLQHEISILQHPQTTCHSWHKDPGWFPPVLQLKYVFCSLSQLTWWLSQCWKCVFAATKIKALQVKLSLKRPKPVRVTSPGAIWWTLGVNEKITNEKITNSSKIQQNDLVSMKLEVENIRNILKYQQIHPNIKYSKSL